MNDSDADELYGLVVACALTVVNFTRASRSPTPTTDVAKPEERRAPSLTSSEQPADPKGADRDSRAIAPSRRDSTMACFLSTFLSERVTPGLGHGHRERQKFEKNVHLPLKSRGLTPFHASLPPFRQAPKASPDKREFVVGPSRSLSGHEAASEPRRSREDEAGSSPVCRRASVPAHRFPDKRTGLHLTSVKAIDAAVEAANMLFEK
jgi:hypothetical protein